MSTMPWFRYYNETPNDRKLKWAAKLAGVNKLTINGAWAVILTLANESPLRGYLLVTLQERFTKQNIIEEFEIDDVTGEKIIDAMLQFELIQVDETGTFYLPNWKNRQFDSDNSTPRVKKHRENKKVTLQKRYSNGPEADTEADTDTEVEEENSAAAPATVPSALSADPGAFNTFVKVTGMISYPGSEVQKIEDALNNLSMYHRGDLAEYLQPFYDEWIKRRYKRTNCAWLYDWAVSGEIPAVKGSSPPHNGNGPGRPKTASELGYTSA